MIDTTLLSSVQLAGPVLVQGAGQPGATVRITANSDLVGQATVDTQGRWRVVVSLMTPGRYVVLAELLDQSGQLLSVSDGMTLEVALATATPSPEPTATETPRPTATPTPCARGAVRVDEICATVTPMPTPTRTPPRPTATLVSPTATPFPTAIPTLRVQTDPIPAGSSESIWARTSFRELSAPGTQSYAVNVRAGERLRWAFEWCALSQSQLQQILAPFALELSIDNVRVPLNDITVDTKTSGSWRCRYWATMISDWPAGQVVALEISYVLSEQIYDGQNYYSPGRYRQIIYATVQ